MNNEKEKDSYLFSEDTEITMKEIAFALETARELSNEAGARTMVALALLRSVSYSLFASLEESQAYLLQRRLSGLEYDLLEAIGMKCKLSREEWMQLMMTEPEDDETLETDKIKSDVLNAEIIFDGGDQ